MFKVPFDKKEWKTRGGLPSTSNILCRFKNANTKIAVCCEVEKSRNSGSIKLFLWKYW